MLLQAAFKKTLEANEKLLKKLVVYQSTKWKENLHMKLKRKENGGKSD